MKSSAIKKAWALLTGPLVGAMFLGANLQTLVRGATPITEQTNYLAEGESYFVSNKAGFDSLEDLVKNGAVNPGAEIDLVSDIDLADKRGYLPGGSAKNPFRAKFNGNNHTLNLVIEETIRSVDSADTREYEGVFGVAYYAEIRNLKVKGRIKVEGMPGMPRDIGAVVGLAERCQIFGCQNECSVEANTCRFVGGLVGLAKGSVLYGCRNKGNLTTDRCYACGGIAGATWKNAAKVFACCNEGDINSVCKNNSRELAGYIVGFATKGEISCCYNTGDVVIFFSDEKIYVLGGAWGRCLFACTAKDCYTLLDSAAVISPGFGGATELRMKSEELVLELNEAAGAEVYRHVAGGFPEFVEELPERDWELD